MRFLTALVLSISLATGVLADSLAAREAFKKGYELLEAKEAYPAIEQFKVAAKDLQFPLLDYSYYYIAQAYRAKNNRPEAIEVYAIVTKFFKNSILIPSCYIAIAELQADNSDYETATTTLREFLAAYPKDELSPKGRYLLGVYLTKLNKNEEAASVFRNLDLLHPKSYFAEQAIDQLDKLAKKSSLAAYEAPAASVYNLGIKYFQAGNYTKAKGYFTRINKFYTKSSFYDEAIVMLGRISQRKGRQKDAAHYFQKAINLNKDSKPTAMFYLAMSYYYEDKDDAAISLLEKVVALYPDHHICDDALYNLGKFYKSVDNKEKSIAAYTTLAARFNDSEFFDEALWAIGNDYYKRGDHAKAYETFKQASSARFLFWTAKSAEKAKGRDEAVAYFKQTVAKYDYSYYGYRAREELKRFGVNLAATSIPEVPDVVDPIKYYSYETVTHEQKYNELLAVGLADEAALEAEFLEEKVPASSKDSASLAKYHAYVMKGKFAKPIFDADQKLLKAMEDNTLADVDPKFWRFSYPRGYWQYVEKYSAKNGLDPHLTYAVIREESRFRSQALSGAAAHGLMQIIPSTGKLLAKALGMRYSRWNMYEPRVNIEMGTYYLAGLIKRFNGNIPLALAGYNGGPARVDRWLKNYDKFDLDEFVEDIPISETRNYVKKVMKSYYGYKRTYSGS